MSTSLAARAAQFSRPCRSSGSSSNVTSCLRVRPLAAADIQPDPVLPSDAPELLAQLALGARQDAATRLREVGARAIDVETQHRKRRAIRVRLFSTARLG